MNHAWPKWKLDWKVGDVDYTFARNNDRRHFGKRDPSYAAKFQAEKIIGETSRSWLLPPDWSPRKYPKKPMPDVYHYLYTAEQVADEAFRQDHAQKVADIVRSADVETLRLIAKLVGYTAG